ELAHHRRNARETTRECDDRDVARGPSTDCPPETAHSVAPRRSVLDALRTSMRKFDPVAQSRRFRPAYRFVARSYNRHPWPESRKNPAWTGSMSAGRRCGKPTEPTDSTALTAGTRSFPSTPHRPQ